MKVYIPRGSDTLNVKRIIFEYDNGEQVEISRKNDLTIRESFRPEITTFGGDPVSYRVDLDLSFFCMVKDK